MDFWVDIEGNIYCVSPLFGRRYTVEGIAEMNGTLIFTFKENVKWP